MLKAPNNSNLTDEELRTLHKVDALGKIEPADRKVLPGLHFCEEWDGLAIFNKALNGMLAHALSRRSFPGNRIHYRKATVERQERFSVKEVT